MTELNITAGNNETLKYDNMALILKLIYKSSGISRLGISNLTGLTGAAITKIVRRLIEAKIVVENKTTITERGRPEIGLTLNCQSYVIVGVHITKQSLKFNLCDLNRNILKNTENSICKNITSEEALSVLCTDLKTFISSIDNKTVIGIGISINESIYNTEKSNLTSRDMFNWKDIKVKEKIESEFGIHTFIEQDVICNALNEYYSNLNEQITSMSFIKVGETVEAAILLDLCTLQGLSWISGEFGHLSISYNGDLCPCGNRGCLRLYCSAEALEKKCGGMKADDIFAGISNGDKKLCDIYTQAAEYLGFGIVSLINLVKTDYIVVSDKFAIPEQLLFNILDGILKSRLSSDVYKNIHLIIHAPSKNEFLLGANALVLHVLFSEPEILFGSLIEGQSKTRTDENYCKFPMMYDNN